MCFGYVTEAEMLVKYYPYILYWMDSHDCHTLYGITWDYLHVNFGLTNTATEDTNSTIWNDLVYINNALGLPIDLMVIRQSDPLHNLSTLVPVAETVAKALKWGGLQLTPPTQTTGAVE